MIKDSKVTPMVSGKHAQGLCIRRGRLARDAANLLAMRWEARGNSLLDEPGSSTMDEALVTKWAGAMALSTFLLSRVSECLLTSYLAEVKLLLSSPSTGCGEVARIAWRSCSSSSSVESNDLVRIELSQHWILVMMTRRK